MTKHIITTVLVLVALSACGGVNKAGRVVPPSPPDIFQGYSMTHGAKGEVIVARNAPMFNPSEGLEARRAAHALCANGVNTSPYDRFQGGSWVFVGGCK